MSDKMKKFKLHVGDLIVNADKGSQLVISCNKLTFDSISFGSGAFFRYISDIEYNLQRDYICIYRAKNNKKYTSKCISNIL